MSRLFDQRERAAETAFAHEEELRFLAHRQAVKSLATWAAECMGLDEEATRAYENRLVDQVIAALPDAHLLTRVQTDLERAGKPTLSTQVPATFSRLLAQATDELRGRITTAPAVEDPLDSWDRRHERPASWGSLRF